MSKLRPHWAENVSVEDALVGMFASNEGDEAILREGFAFLKREREAYEAGRLAGFEDGLAASQLNVERLRQATDNVREMDPLDYLDEGDETDAIAAEYVRLEFGA